MTDPTEAQAAMLTAVASHLTNHPDLCPVNIMSNDKLQVRSADHPGRALVAWADTLTDPRVDVHSLTIKGNDGDETQAFVYVVGHLDNEPMTVWDVVDGLADALGSEAFDTTGHVEITVDALRAYSRDGTAPIPAGSVPA